MSQWSLPMLDPTEVLWMLAARSCETFTTGPGSCFKPHSERIIAARYGGDQVCSGCLALAAITLADGGGAE